LIMSHHHHPHPHKLHVVVSGATGALGPHVVEAFLAEPTRHNIAKLTVLTRNPNSTVAQGFAKRGVEVVLTQAPLVNHFKNVDVYISTIGPGENLDGHKAKQELMEAAAAAGVKIYLPSEFGNDWRLKDWPHPEWDAKAAHEASARKTKMKVISVFAALFLEDSFGAWIGLDTENHLWKVAGKGSARVTYTSKGDIGRTAAALTILAANEPRKVPDYLRICGDTNTVQEALNIMSAVSGETIKLEEEDLAAYKRETLATKPGNSHYLRFMMGDGTLDHSRDNQNNVFNPHQCNWKWKTVRDLAKETGGKPV